ncbi:MAG TPA: hypothetical protein VIY28_02175 [Pseudonocardiaceae bacterium]
MLPADSLAQRLGFAGQLKHPDLVESCGLHPTEMNGCQEWSAQADQRAGELVSWNCAGPGPLGGPARTLVGRLVDALLVLRPAWRRVESIPILAGAGWQGVTTPSGTAPGRDFRWVGGIPGPGRTAGRPAGSRSSWQGRHQDRA